MSLLDGLDQETLEALGKAVRTLMARKRYSRAMARRIRKVLIEAYGGYCAGCQRKHSAILQIHHADPVSENGGDDPKHMYPLCPNCHAYVHALRKARAKPATRSALEAEILHVHEGDADIVPALARLADTKSTREAMQELVAEYVAKDEAE